MRGVLLSDLVRTSEAVSLASGRRVKIDEIAGLLRRAAPDEIPVAVAFLSGELRQRQIGVGYAALGGLLRDAHVNVSRVFQFGALTVAVCAVLLWFIKPRRAASG